MVYIIKKLETALKDGSGDTGESVDLGFTLDHLTIILIFVWCMYNCIDFCLILICFQHKDGSGDTSESVDVGLVGSVDLDNNRESANLDALDTSHLNFTDVDYSQILHPQNTQAERS